MGARILSWALRQKAGPARLLLIMLANEAGDERGDCAPSQEFLAELTETSPATVARHLTDLEKRGLIFRARKIRDKGDGRFASASIVVLAHQGAASCAARLGWSAFAQDENISENGGEPLDEDVDGQEGDCEPESSITQNERRATISRCEDSTFSGPIAQNERWTSPHFDARSSAQNERRRNLPASGEIDGEAVETTPETTSKIGASRVHTHTRARAVGNYLDSKIPIQKKSFQEFCDTDPDLAKAWTQFETVWPWGLAEPFEPAKRQFLKLSPVDRALAIQWVPAFAEVQKKLRRKPGRADAYLRTKGWEPVSRGKVEKARTQVFVEEGSLGWIRWSATRATPWPTIKNSAGKTGWYFPSEFPPVPEKPPDPNGDDMRDVQF